MHTLQSQPRGGYKRGGAAGPLHPPDNIYAYSTESTQGRIQRGGGRTFTPPDNIYAYSTVYLMDLV